MPQPIIGDVVRFTLAFNPGAAFSMSLGDILALHLRRVRGRRAVILWRLYRTQPAGRHDCACSRSASRGAARRATHRPFSPRRSGVVDFIDIGVGDVRFWTFNVADSAVTVGALMLAWVLWREDRRALAIAAAEAAARDERRSAERGRARSPAADLGMRYATTSIAPDDAPRLDSSGRGAARSVPESGRDPDRRRAGDRWTGGASGRATEPRAGERITVEIPPPRWPGGLRGRHPAGGRVSRTTTCWSSTSRREWSSIRPRELDGHPRERPQGAGRRRCRRRLTRAGRASSTGWTRRRPGCCWSPRRDRAHRVLGAALQARQIVRRYAVLCLGTPGGGPNHGRTPDRPRSARPKAHGSRQYRTGGEDRSHAARALRLRGPAAGAPLYGTHASDPSTSRLDRASGRRRRHVRRGRGPQADGTRRRAAISCTRRGWSSVIRCPEKRSICARRCRKICIARSWSPPAPTFHSPIPTRSTSLDSTDVDP